MKEYMKVEEGQREKLKTEMERLHTYITQLSQTFYDPDKEKVMVNYPNNSEGRQLEQVIIILYRLSIQEY